MRWAGYVAYMVESRSVYRVMMGKPEGKKPHGRPRRRCRDNTKMDLLEVTFDGVDWTDVPQVRDRWWHL